MVTYSEPKCLSKQCAEKAFDANDAECICEALLSVSLYESDWKWAQDKCLGFLDAEDSDVRGLAVTCLGHIARVHRQLEKEKVLAALRDRLGDSEISGRIEDALDDIDVFLR